MSSSTNSHVSEVAVMKITSCGAPFLPKLPNIISHSFLNQITSHKAHFSSFFYSLSFEPIEIFNNFTKWPNHPRSARVHPPPLWQLEHHVSEPPEYPRHQFHPPCHPLHYFHLMNNISDTPLSFNLVKFLIPNILT